MNAETTSTDTTEADAKALIEAVASGRPLDPDVARRVRERADAVRSRLLPGRDIGTRIIRELRGPLDETQERELTLSQSDLIRKGELRLTDPDTGKVYVLVPEEEYERLRAR
jgi:hypothetical protein